MSESDDDDLEDEELQSSIGDGVDDTTLREMERVTLGYLCRFGGGVLSAWWHPLWITAARRWVMGSYDRMAAAHPLRRVPVA